MFCDKETRGVPRTFVDENNDVSVLGLIFFLLGEGGVKASHKDNGTRRYTG